MEVHHTAHRVPRQTDETPIVAPHKCSKEGGTTLKIRDVTDVPNSIDTRERIGWDDGKRTGDDITAEMSKQLTRTKLHVRRREMIEKNMIY